MEDRVAISPDLPCPLSLPPAKNHPSTHERILLKIHTAHTNPVRSG